MDEDVLGTLEVFEDTGGWDEETLNEFLLMVLDVLELAGALEAAGAYGGVLAVTVGEVYTTGPESATTNLELPDVTGTDDEQEDGTEHDTGRVQVAWDTQEENDL